MSDSVNITSKNGQISSTFLNGVLKASQTGNASYVPYVILETISQVNASAGDGSTSVSVPNNCSLVVAFWSHWDDNLGNTINDLTLNGSSFTINQQVGDGSNINGCGVATLSNPSTGSQTFAWDWVIGGSIAEGGVIFLVYINHSNPVDIVRDTALDGHSQATNTTVTLTTEPTDLVLALAQDYNDPNHGPLELENATLFVDELLINKDNYDLGQINTVSGGSTTIDMTG